jgi:hypothetical protein
MFRKMDLFPSSDELREAPTLLGPLQRANRNQCIRVGVYLVSPKDANRFSFRNVMFSSYLEFR